MCTRTKPTANGSSRRPAAVTPYIGRIDVADLVLATDPKTGGTGARPVTDRIAGDGVKHLVDVTVDCVVVTATAQHPFWVDDQAAGSTPTACTPATSCG